MKMASIFYAFFLFTLLFSMLKNALGFALRLASYIGQSLRTPYMFIV